METLWNKHVCHFLENLFYSDEIVTVQKLAIITISKTICDLTYHKLRYSCFFREVGQTLLPILIRFCCCLLNVVG